MLLILAASAVGAELTGKVVKIVDGDTVYVLDAENTQHKIRLATGSLYSLAYEEAKSGAGVLMGHACLVRGALQAGGLIALFDDRWF